MYLWNKTFSWTRLRETGFKGLLSLLCIVGLGCLALGCSAHREPDGQQPPHERPDSSPPTTPYAALFHEGGAESRSRRDMSELAFATARRQLHQAGWVLTDFERAPDPATGTSRFSGTWVVDGGEERWLSLSCADFEARRAQFAEEGWRLRDFESWTQNDRAVCAGAWSRAEASHEPSSQHSDQPSSQHSDEGRELWVHDVPCQNLEHRIASQQSRDWKLTDFEVWDQGGITRCSGLWHSGEDDSAVLLTGLDLPKFDHYLRLHREEGKQLVELETHSVRGRTLYSGIWRSGSQAYWLWVGDTLDCLELRTRTLAQGIPAGERVPSCDTGAPDDHDHDDHQHLSPNPEHAPSEGGFLEPGASLKAPLPPLHLVDLEVGLERVGDNGSSVNTASAGPTSKDLDHTIHLGVLHDGGSSGPGG